MKKIIALLMAAMLINSLAVTASAASASEKQTADALHSLGLFLGTGDNADGTPNYELDGNLTRSQAVVLLVRMLGKENAATKGSYTHPFKDTASWYDKHVGYAYANKLTNGTGTDTYSGEMQTSAQMFTTFCLRALGYDDMSDKPDFSWDKASEKAEELGIHINLTGSFTRGEAVETFWNALNTKMKGVNWTLAEKLESDGVFSKTDFTKATKIKQSGNELSMDELSESNGVSSSSGGSGGSSGGMSGSTSSGGGSSSNAGSGNTSNAGNSTTTDTSDNQTPELIIQPGENETPIDEL